MGGLEGVPLLSVSGPCPPPGEPSQTAFSPELQTLSPLIGPKENQTGTNVQSTTGEAGSAVGTTNAILQT